VIKNKRYYITARDIPKVLCIPLSGFLGPVNPSRELLSGKNSWEPYYISSLPPSNLPISKPVENHHLFFTPIQEQSVSYEMQNMIQKRKKKMNKHKHRKRLKRDRFWRRKHKK